MNIVLKYYEHCCVVQTLQWISLPYYMWTILHVDYMYLGHYFSVLQVWERADPHNGYVCQFQVYTWKKRGAAGVRVAEIGLGSRVVKDLTVPLQGKQHEIFMDNFFSSPQLFEDLHADGIYATGNCIWKHLLSLYIVSMNNHANESEGMQIIKT